MAAAVPFIALALSAVGTGVAFAGSLQQAKAAEEAAKYNAKIDENNALAARQQAEAEALQIRRANRLRAGSQRAAYGKAGVDLSAGDDVIYDTGAQGELEALSALYAGQTQSSYYQSRATGNRFEGRQARTAGNYNAAASLIGGVAQGAGIFARSGNSGSQPSFNQSAGVRNLRASYGS